MKTKTIPDYSSFGLGALRSIPRTSLQVYRLAFFASKASCVSFALTAEAAGLIHSAAFSFPMPTRFAGLGMGAKAPKRKPAGRKKRCFSFVGRFSRITPKLQIAQQQRRAFRFAARSVVCQITKAPPVAPAGKRIGVPALTI